MNVCSIPFLLACALAAIIFHLLPGKLIRQVFLSLLNVAFLVQFIPNRSTWVLCVLFIGGTYALVRLVKAKPSGYIVGIAIAGIIGVFLVAKKYTFLHGILPTSIWERSIELVGLSYMLFKFIHVLVDEWQGLLDECTFFRYANYQLAFFTLLAGPIQRYNDFNAFWTSMDNEPGDEKQNLLAWDRILNGMIKMGAIAPLAWYVFENANPLTPSEQEASPLLWSALWFYSYPVYLYFNFSGYTDIVIGCGRLFGLELPENFNRPWLARNMLDFWSRWHISLTNWIREYVFLTSYQWAVERFPRGGKPLGYLFIFGALVLAGIWHGASAGFLVFGIIHGFGAAVNRAYGDVLQAFLGRAGLDRYRKSKVIELAAIVLTFHYVCFSFLFFSSGRMALQIIRKIAHQFLVEKPLNSVFQISPAMIAVAAVLLILLVGFWKKDLLGACQEWCRQKLTSALSPLYGLVSLKTVFITVLLVSLWALEQKNQVVVYMKF